MRKASIDLSTMIEMVKQIVLCSVMPVRVARMALKSLDYRLLRRLKNVQNSEEVFKMHMRECAVGNLDKNRAVLMAATSP